jgi:hypothetical protein
MAMQQTVAAEDERRSAFLLLLASGGSSVASRCDDEFPSTRGFADGKVIGNTDTADYNEIIEKEAFKKFPERTNVPSVASNSGGGVEQIVIWKVGLYADGQYKQLPAFRLGPSVCQLKAC